MFIGAGSVKVGTIDDWIVGAGSVVSWHPSAASLEKARQAPVSAVPASYMQAQHLRGFCEFGARGSTIHGWSQAPGTGPAAATFVLLLTLLMHTSGDTTPTAVGSSTTVWIVSFGIPLPVQ